MNPSPTQTDHSLTHPAVTKTPSSSPNRHLTAQHPRPSSLQPVTKPFIKRQAPLTSAAPSDSATDPRHLLHRAPSPPPSHENRQGLTTSHDRTGHTNNLDSRAEEERDQRHLVARVSAIPDCWRVYSRRGILAHLNLVAIDTDVEDERNGRDSKHLVALALPLREPGAGRGG